MCWCILQTCTAAQGELGPFFFFFFFNIVNLYKIFKGRLELSHRGSDLIPFIRQRERNGQRLHVSLPA